MKSVFLHYHRSVALTAKSKTTAHTLCFTLGLLALYPDQQEILYQKIMEVLPDGRLPVSDHNHVNTPVLTVLHRHTMT